MNKKYLNIKKKKKQSMFTYLFLHRIPSNAYISYVLYYFEIKNDLNDKNTNKYNVTKMQMK